MDGTTRLQDPRPTALFRQPPHAVHGLVAIANGPDFCLCGNYWPCRTAGEAEAQAAA